MGRSLAIGCLAVATGALFASMVLIPLFADAIDNSAALRLVAIPFVFTMPFGPFVLSTVLFALLGRSRRPDKLAARLLAALLFCGAFFLVVGSVAFTGHFVLDPTDDGIATGLAIGAALLAWFGFSRAKGWKD